MGVHYQTGPIVTKEQWAQLCDDFIDVKQNTTEDGRVQLSIQYVTARDLIERQRELAAAIASLPNQHS